MFFPNYVCFFSAYKDGLKIGPHRPPLKKEVVPSKLNFKFSAHPDKHKRRIMCPLCLSQTDKHKRHIMCPLCLSQTWCEFQIRKDAASAEAPGVLLGALVCTFLSENGVNLTLMINLLWCGKKPRLLKKPTRLHHRPNSPVGPISPISPIVITKHHVFRLFFCLLIRLLHQGRPKHPSIHLFSHDHC